MSVIFDMVKNIAVYLIFVTIVMNLIDKSSFKKYVSIFTGMLLIFIVISPIFKLLHLTDSMDYFFDKNMVSVEVKEMEESLSGVEEKQKNQILQDYKERIKVQIETILKSYHLYQSDCNITLEEGSITAIEVTAGYFVPEEEINLDQQAQDKVEAVKKVEIAEVKVSEKEDRKNKIDEEAYQKIESTEMETKNAGNQEKEEITKALADFYLLPPECIDVIIV